MKILPKSMRGNNDRTHGVTEFYKVSSKIEEAKESVLRKGYYVFDNMVDKKKVSLAKKKLLDIYKKQVIEDNIVLNNFACEFRATIIYTDNKINIINKFPYNFWCNNRTFITRDYCNCFHILMTIILLYYCEIFKSFLTLVLLY